MLLFSEFVITIAENKSTINAYVVDNIAAYVNEKYVIIFFTSWINISKSDVVEFVVYHIPYCRSVIFTLPWIQC